MPTYPDIRLALASPWEVARRIDAAGADHIHIATEGPIGWAARRYCRKRGKLFTTSYHTRFPEYIAARTRLPEVFTYAALRRFHAPAAATLAPTTVDQERADPRGFDRVKVWTRGVDHALYRPRPADAVDLPRPIFLCVGRVAVEKNLEALLELKLPGSVVIVGDGPARATLERRYPHAHFLGALYGEALARIYASADVFVFPSKTDTFGIVLIEALASGLPVAAFPVVRAARRDRRERRRRAQSRSWRRVPGRPRNSARASARTFAAFHLAGERAAIPAAYRSQPGGRRRAVQPARLSR